MAVTVSGAPTAGGKNARISLDAVDGNATSVSVPAWVRRVTLTFVDSGSSAAAGKVHRGTQTDGATMSTHAFPVGAGAAYELTLAPSRTRISGGATIHLSGSASGYAHLDMEL